MKNKQDSRESREHKAKQIEREERDFRDNQKQYFIDAISSDEGFCNPMKCRIEEDEE